MAWTHCRHRSVVRPHWFGRLDSNAAADGGDGGEDADARNGRAERGASAPSEANGHAENAANAAKSDDDSIGQRVDRAADVLGDQA